MMKGLCFKRENHNRLKNAFKEKKLKLKGTYLIRFNN